MKGCVRAVPLPFRSIDLNDKEIEEIIPLQTLSQNALRMATDELVRYTGVMITRL